MPLETEAFVMAFNRARDRVRRDGATDVAAEQQQLRALLPDDLSEEDRTWTTQLIERLAEPPEPPPTWSALYDEAGRVHAEAYAFEGTEEQRIEAFRTARRRIFEIAERADPDEAAEIRAMARPLEHLENGLRDQSWPRTGSSGEAG
jgi:hypothetical protein